MATCLHSSGERIGQEWLLVMREPRIGPACFFAHVKQKFCFPMWSCYEVKTSRSPNVIFIRLLALLFIAGLLLSAGTSTPSIAQPVDVQLPSINGQTGETVDINIQVDDITNEEITAYQFTVQYDPSVLTINGAAAEQTLTPSAPIINTQQQGVVKVAWAASSPLSGSGTLLTLQGELVGPGSSALSFSSFRFEDINVQEVATNLSPGRVSVAEFSSSQPVNGDGDIGFGSTGVSINFSGVSGSGDVTVSKFSDRPLGTDSISESNVSSYRFVIEAGGDLAFGSDTEVRLDVSTLRGVTNPEEIVIYKRVDQENSFAALSSTYDADANVLIATTNSFSEFVLASDSSPLPVEITSFEAVRNGINVRLQWSTASETNNSGFEVQHQSFSRDTWKNLGFVEGQGTTTQPHSYAFPVEELSPGTHSFRLQQVDVDGSVALSNAVTVTLPVQDVLRLTSPAPNPVSGETRFQVGVQDVQKVTVAVYNIRGQRVVTLYRGSMTPTKMKTVRLNTEMLASGMYFIRATSESHTRTQQLTVVK